MLIQKFSRFPRRRACVCENPLIRRGLAGGLAMLAAVWAGQPVNCARGADTSDPVIGLLLQKGVITEDEAAKAEAQIASERTNEAAPQLDSKWKISSGIKSVELYGDIRLRFEDRDARNSSGDILLQRYRYSLRFGLRGEAGDDFYYGFRLDTSSNPRSSMVTFGTSTSGTVPYSGPYGKSTGGIDVGLVYLGWKPESWFDIEAGKMPNPLYTSSMVWSPAITPEGFAEKLKYTVGEADFFGTFGQFLYQDVNPVQTSSGFFSNLGDYSGSSMPFQLAWQGGVDYHITKKVDFKIAPVIYDYVGNTADTGATAPQQSPGFGDIYVGQGAATGGISGYPNGQYDGYYANQTGINDLLVLEIPAEVNFKLEKYDFRVFGDYAQNLSGGSRADAAYTQSHSPVYVDNLTPIDPISSPQTRDNVAYQAGVAIGSPGALGLVNGTASKRHAWELRSYWQHVEQYSLDPNLIDLDFFSGQENLQGVYADAGYGFSDNIIGAFRYGYATRINNQLGTGGSGTDIPQMNPVNQFSIFQVDMTLRF